MKALKYEANRAWKLNTPCTQESRSSMVRGPVVELGGKQEGDRIRWAPWEMGFVLGQGRRVEIVCLVPWRGFIRQTARPRMWLACRVTVLPGALPLCCSDLDVVRPTDSITHVDPGPANCIPQVLQCRKPPCVCSVPGELQ